GRADPRAPAGDRRDVRARRLQHTGVRARNGRGAGHARDGGAARPDRVRVRPAAAWRRGEDADVGFDRACRDPRVPRLPADGPPGRGSSHALTPGDTGRRRDTYRVTPWGPDIGADARLWAPRPHFGTPSLQRCRMDRARPSRPGFVADAGPRRVDAGAGNRTAGRTTRWRKALRPFLLAGAAALALGGCSTAMNQPVETAAQAPAADADNTVPDDILLQDWSGPFDGVPPFDQVRPDLFPEAFEYAIDERRREIQAITRHRAAPTFDNIIVPLERSGQRLSRVLAVFGVMTSNMATPEYQAIQREWAPRLAAATDEIFLDPHL